MKTQLAIGTALMAALAAPGLNAQVVVAPRARAAQAVRMERPWLGIGVKDITDAAGVGSSMPWRSAIPASCRRVRASRPNAP